MYKGKLKYVHMQFNQHKYFKGMTFHLSNGALVDCFTLKLSHTGYTKYTFFHDLSLFWQSRALCGTVCIINVLSGLVGSFRRALASKLRGPGFKSRPGTVGGPVTIIMWGARPGWKLALS